jgi:hypothetical protein
MADFHPGFLLNAVVFALLASSVRLAFVVLDKMSACALKEIIEDQNTPRYPSRSHVHWFVHYCCRRANRMDGV